MDTKFKFEIIIDNQKQGIEFLFDINKLTEIYKILNTLNIYNIDEFYKVIYTEHVKDKR